MEEKKKKKKKIKKKKKKKKKKKVQKKKYIYTWPMALEVKYKILYPLWSISWYKFATPICVQSFPTIVYKCPNTSDLYNFIYIIL